MAEQDDSRLFPHLLHEIRNVKINQLIAGLAEGYPQCTLISEYCTLMGISSVDSILADDWPILL